MEEIRGSIYFYDIIIYSKLQLYNDTLNTFFWWLYDIGHVVENLSDNGRENQLPPVRGLFLRLAAMEVLYEPAYRHDIYHGLSYTSYGELPGTRYRSVGVRWI